MAYEALERTAWAWRKRGRRTASRYGEEGGEQEEEGAVKIVSDACRWL